MAPADTNTPGAEIKDALIYDWAQGNAMKEPDGKSYNPINQCQRSGVSKCDIEAGGRRSKDARGTDCRLSKRNVSQVLIKGSSDDHSAVQE